MKLNRSSLILVLYLLIPIQNLWSQKAQVIKGPKIRVGVHATVIAADSNVVMVYTEGKGKQKLLSFTLPKFEKIEEYTIERDISYFIPTGRGVLGIQLVFNWEDKIRLLTKQFIPGKCEMFNWITCYEGADSIGASPEIFPSHTKEKHSRELPQKNRSYFSGYEVIWSPEDNAVYSCILSNNVLSGTSMHVVRMDLDDESLVTQSFQLTADTQPVFLNYFAIQNGNYIVKTSFLTQGALPIANDDIYIINAVTLELKSFSVNAYLPKTRKITSNTVFISNSKSTLTAVGIIEPADSSGSHYNGLFRICFNIDKRVVDTCIIDPLPYEYFENSRGQKGRNIFIDKIWSNRDSTLHLACYSYFFDEYEIYHQNYRSPNPTPQYSSSSIQALRSRELILIDLNPDYSIRRHQMFLRNAFHQRSSNIKVLAYRHNYGRNLIITDLKQHYNRKGERSAQIPDLGSSIHSTLGIGKLNNNDRWEFTELKLNSNYTFYPSGFVQSSFNQFVAVGIPLVSKNRICLIKINE